MIFWGTTPQGKKLLLGEPEKLRLAYDKEAPADLLQAVFPAEALWEELMEVTALEDGAPVFRGLVDEQNTVLSSQGFVVELVCRSREALLLDSEAPPGTVFAPSLPLLETRLLTPLGLALGEGDKSKKQGSLTTEKGESRWTVLKRFCGDFLGTEPFVDLDGLVQCGGAPPRDMELTEVISAEISLLPCKRISQVWRQSCRGGYDTLYRSGRPGAPRIRYAGMESGGDPRKTLAEGERDSFRLTVTCTGLRWPGRNGRASVTMPGAGRYENCPVRAALYRRDGNGDRTRLVLEQGKGESLCG